MDARHYPVISIQYLMPVSTGTVSAKFSVFLPTVGEEGDIHPRFLRGSAVTPIGHTSYEKEGQKVADKPYREFTTILNSGSWEFLEKLVRETKELVVTELINRNSTYNELLATKPADREVVIEI